MDGFAFFTSGPATSASAPHDKVQIATKTMKTIMLIPPSLRDDHCPADQPASFLVVGEIGNDLANTPN